MATHITTAVSVFSESDVEHPAADVSRVGNDGYVAIGYAADGSVAGKALFPTIEEALAAADAHADLIDAGPTLPEEKIALSRTIKEQAAQIADLQAQIAALQGQAVDVKVG